jgi:hypothetical protein
MNLNMATRESSLHMKKDPTQNTTTMAYNSDENKHGNNKEPMRMRLWRDGLLLFLSL